jgi:sulfatase modifying factor 1
MRAERPFRFAIVFAAAAFAASCSCDESSPSPRDSGSVDGDADADGSVDSGPELVDPEVYWVAIPAGSYTFGSPPGTVCMGPMTEKEVPVTLSRSFEISQFEITQRQWKALAFPLPHRAQQCDDCPIGFINHYEAAAWCNALSEFEGLEPCYDLSGCSGEVGSGCPDGDWYRLGCFYYEPGVYEEPTYVDDLFVCPGITRRYASMYDCDGYRLPTGPEWEYAAKAGTTTNTYNGDMTDDHGEGCADEPILNDIAWYCENTGAGNSDTNWSQDLLREVGLKQPNPWGLYDMLGNSGEWVDYVGTGFSLDLNEGKPDEALVDPMGTTEDDDERGDVRGDTAYANPCYVRASHHFLDNRKVRIFAYGFRPVRTLPATAPDAGADSGSK